MPFVATHTSTHTDSRTQTSPAPTFRAVYAGTCAVTGTRFAPGALIYKNPNGRGYVLSSAAVSVSAPRRDPVSLPRYTRTTTNTRTYPEKIKPAPTTAPEVVADLDKLAALYRSMDWTYEFSDDGGVVRRGDAALRHILNVEAACVAAGLATPEDLQAQRRMYIDRAMGR